MQRVRESESRSRFPQRVNFGQTGIHLVPVCSDLVSGGFSKDGFQFTFELIDQSLDPGVIDTGLDGVLQLPDNLEDASSFRVSRRRRCRFWISRFIHFNQFIHRRHDDIRSGDAANSSIITVASPLLAGSMSAAA